MNCQCDSADTSFLLFRRFEELMAAVARKFFIASMMMWIAPLAILYGFNNNLLPGMIYRHISCLVRLQFVEFVIIRMILVLRLVSDSHLYCMLRFSA